MKLTDERILDYINKKFEGKNINLEQFLNPSENDFRDVSKLFNIEFAVSKIKQAINDNKKILVYGDYDSDGICATTILYLYLKSQNANVNVFIPNRFENGYGISIDAIEEIQYEYAPDLIITVDLGITAVEEVEILKQEGIDIIVTDHHLPLEEVPDCIIIDPKYNNKEYGFDALCGAGVALKLVEALSDRETFNKYLDICAIATIGDIVPLIDENRAIAKLGIDKINSGNCFKSITFMLKKLGIETITSTDVSFKIVPRLNACGRMDNALKVFDFLIETDDKLLEEKYAEIESDNTLRLASIDKGNKIIEKQLKDYDINEPSVLVVGDFHEGIIGILASRICHEYNKPAIIFTRTENGTLKGSGRSIDMIDIHKIISTMSGMLENFGGHKMAVGVEIEPDVFDTFKETLNSKILEISNSKDFLINGSKYDIEIFDNDLNLDFYNQVSMLEPFGCDNEKPIFMLRQNKMLVEPISEKVFKHYRLFTSKNNTIVAFNFYNHVQTIKSESEKMLFVDLNIDKYKNKETLSVIAKNVKILQPDLTGLFEEEFSAALYNKYYSIFDFNNYDNYKIVDNIQEIIMQKLRENDYGTLVVASNNADLEIINRLNLNDLISDTPFANAQNAVLVSPYGVYNLDDVKSYKNIIFLHKYFNEEHLYFSQKLVVYEPKDIIASNIKLTREREVFAKAYKLITNFANLKANNVLDFACKLNIKDSSIKLSQLLYCIIVFMELNFIEFDEKLNNFIVAKSKKVELSSSKFYNLVE